MLSTAMKMTVDDGNEILKWNIWSLFSNDLLMFLSEQLHTDLLDNWNLNRKELNSVNLGALLSDLEFF